MSISGIGASGVGYDNMSKMSSIATASDNPSGLAIAEKLESAKNGYDVGIENAGAGRDAIRTADSALSSITDNLQRIRELGLKASNTAIYGPDELSAIQAEIVQVKQTIQDTAQGTQFNNIKLLDGSKADLQLATNPEGTGMKIQLANATLDELGIADFDVTKNFNLDDIDKALQQVSKGRSSLGAQSNALESTMNYNALASYNMTSSKSSIEDLDIGSFLAQRDKDNILEQYRNFTKKAEIDNNNQAMVMQKMFR